MVRGWGPGNDGWTRGEEVDGAEVVEGEEGAWERRHLPRIGVAVERGTGDDPYGNSMSRAKNRLERAQEEIGGEKEEGAGGRDIGVETP